MYNMITIKTPNKYINEPNILKSAGEYITKLGKHALIVGGKTALSVVGRNFLNSLKNSDISYVIKEFQGYPTYNAIEKISSLAVDVEADIIIGVGGGHIYANTIKSVGLKRVVRVCLYFPPMAQTVCVVSINSAL